MKNVVGTPARGSNFFQRHREIEKIKDRIEAGNNLQVAAPRRVGKTSILFYLHDNHVDGHIYVYVDTERIDNEQAFYKKLLKAILKVHFIAESKKLKQLVERGIGFFKKIKSIKIMGQGVDFHENDQEPDYYEDLTNFLSGFELEDDRKLVLLIDEFPQTIINIVDSQKGDTRAATQFLQSNRELRINPDINQKVRFIYTGSVGLNHTVASINATAFVNDLNSIEVDQLDEQEAKDLVRELLRGKKFTIDESAVDHLLQKIGWLIPFHIQLAIQEITSVCYQKKIADRGIVDKAFENMVEARNNNHFEHYYSRLRSQFKNDLFDYAEDLLQTIAMNGSIEAGQLYDMAVKYKAQDKYRQVIEVLMYDGYMNNTGTPSTYRFNSPVVRLWWQKFICK